MVAKEEGESDITRQSSGANNGLGEAKSAEVGNRQHPSMVLLISGLEAALVNVFTRLQSAHGL